MNDFELLDSDDEILIEGRFSLAASIMGVLAMLTLTFVFMLFSESLTLGIDQRFAGGGSTYALASSLVDFTGMFIIMIAVLLILRKSHHKNNPQATLLAGMFIIFCTSVIPFLFVSYSELTADLNELPDWTEEAALFFVPGFVGKSVGLYYSYIRIRRELSLTR